MEFGSEHILLKNQSEEEYFSPEEIECLVSESAKKSLRGDAQTCMLDILDTAGQEEYSAMRDQYVRSGQGFLIIYSITSRSSFMTAPLLREQILMIKDEDDFPMVLVGNKSDLDHERQVTTNEGRTLAASWTVPFFEVSAKTGSRLEDAFFELVREIYQWNGCECPSLLKIVLLGDGGVGKSTCCLQFVNNHFVVDYDPTIENSYRKQVHVPGLPTEKRNRGVTAPKNNEPSMSVESKKPSLFSQLFRSTLFSSRTVSQPKSVSPPQSVSQPQSVSSPPPTEEKNIRTKKNGDLVLPKASTNSFVLKLGTLVHPLAVNSGDPVYCQKCRVILSITSRLVCANGSVRSHNNFQIDSEDTYHWSCEFCGQENRNIILEAHELPSQSVIEFILSTPNLSSTTSSSSTGTSEVKVEEPLMIYCFDISGSMCVSSQVEALQSEWKVLRERGSGSTTPTPKNVPRDQFLPGESPTAQYTSRIEFMKTAVITHLERLHVQNPKQPVILITFNSEIVVIGDGSGSTPMTITGDVLSDFEKLIKKGQEIQVKNLRCIKDSKEDLIERVQNFEEGGATALGPSLVLAAGIASQRPRSEIVICTDGIPNVGVGSLDEECQLKASKQFYQDIGDQAKNHRTKVSVIGIEGSDGVGLEHLAVLSETTGGSCAIVKPIELARQIRKLSQKPTTGTDVVVNVAVHPSLEILSRINDVSTSTNSRSENGHRKFVTTHNFKSFDIGNANVDTDISIQFMEFKEQQQQQTPESFLTKIPFQTQVYYTRLDGTGALRVFSGTREPTQSYQVCEERCDIAVVALTAIQNAARIATQNLKQHGSESKESKMDYYFEKSESTNQYLKARQELHRVERLLTRVAKSGPQKEEVANFINLVEELDGALFSCVQNVKNGRKMKDEEVKILMNMKQAGLSLLYCSERNQELVERSKGNPALRAQYYNIRF